MKKNQDQRQKIKSLFLMGLETYKLLMASMLILFVPQECDDHNCTIMDNFYHTQDTPKNVVLTFNLFTMIFFFVLYILEYRRENLLITYLEVNPKLPRTEDAVRSALMSLDDTRRQKLQRYNTDYKRIVWVSLAIFFINLIMSTIIIFFHYLNTKTVTVLLTNIAIMSTKMYNCYTIANTPNNIFYSAYMTRNIQFNDVDPDKRMD